MLGGYKSNITLEGKVQNVQVAVGKTCVKHLRKFIMFNVWRNKMPNRLEYPFRGSGSYRFTTTAARLNRRSGHEGFVVDKVSLRQVFSE
jgi:hypothetical protein